jgi:hypothetical protein
LPSWTPTDGRKAAESRAGTDGTKHALRAACPRPTAAYRPRRPEETTLYNVVRENLETLYGAVSDGAVRIALPAFVRKELEGYLDCGLLCRGFARLRCEACGESRLVAFSCKGRGFCPSCLGRRMCATAANLVEHVLPAAGFYATRMKKEGHAKGQSGAVVVVQRTSADLKLNPHLHVVLLDGVFQERDGALRFHELSRISTRDVADVLERACRRMHSNPLTSGVAGIG